MRSVLSPFSDPFLNLAIETVLFKHKPIDQHLLFVYFNSPCVVIGRNQNPWAECKLNTDIPLLRRRSGGGAVVHSLGNANFCVQSSRNDFSRTKHLEMVCAAFPDLGLRINSRHDLVMGPENDPRKVSGSSYKIEKGKAYHHATLLLDVDLSQLGSLLRPDPAVQGTVTTSGGTDSVRSPVTNTELMRHAFVRGIFRQFQDMYKHELATHNLNHNLDQLPKREPRDLGVPPGVEIAEINDEVREEAESLKSWEWVFGKTPKFSIDWPNGKHLEVKQGLITSGWDEMEGQRLPLHI